MNILIYQKMLSWIKKTILFTIINFSYEEQLKHLQSLIQNTEVSIDKVESILGEPLFKNNETYYYFFSNKNDILQVRISFQYKKIVHITKLSIKRQNHLKNIPFKTNPLRLPFVQNLKQYLTIESNIFQNNFINEITKSQGESEQKLNQRIEYTNALQEYNLFKKSL